MFTINEMSRLYDNKLQRNLNTFEKAVKKELNAKVKSLLIRTAKKNAKRKSILVIVTSEEKDEIRDILGKVLFLEDNSVLSTAMLQKAAVSAMKCRLVATEKGVKQEGWAYSVSDFLKALNACLVKTVTMNED